MIKTKLTKEQFEKWKRQSEDLIISLFLRHPETEKEMVVVSDLFDNGDGTFSFIVTDDPNGDTAFQFLVGMTEVTKKDIDDALKEEKNPETKSPILTPFSNTGNIVGLDGQPLTL